LFFVLFILLKKLEIFEIDFTEEDRFIILASDGLWEFMESEEVNIYNLKLI